MDYIEAVEDQEQDASQEKMLQCAEYPE